jgi:hypothetical protein
MLLVSCLLGASLLAAPQQPPARIVQAGPSTPAPAAQPAPAPALFDENADAAAQIAAAQGRAATENRRVLLVWGTNDSQDSQLLLRTAAKDPDVAKTLQYEYESVRIDVGRSAKNQALAAQYGADLKASGLPVFTVLDATGKVLANQPVATFRSEAAGTPGFDLKRVNAFLISHQAVPLNADTLFKDALAAARRDHKRVFLRFGAPW